MRVGIGYDIHGLKKGRKLVLGGVRIPYDRGLEGHSDGDVLVHALVDAVLGAAAAGDIGDYFPPGDKRTKGADSRLFARKAVEILKKKKLKIVHLDAVVVAEAPKLAGYKEAMRREIAKMFGVAATQVGLKGKTNEGFGPVGKNKAIACFAAASLKGR